MKKTKLFAYVCLVALVSAGMSSCKNDEPGQQRQQVPTSIAISLPGQVGAPSVRHMPGTTVQKNGYTDFAANGGMKNLVLVPFGQSATVTSSSVRIGDNISLENLTTGNAYSDVTNGGRTHVYTEKNVPQGTSAFLFYGEAATTGTNFQKGVLSPSLSGNPSAIHFDLEKIVANAGTVEADDAYVGLIAYLNSIANASDGAKAWKAYTAGDNEGLYQLFQTFASATTLSSFGIERMADDLYHTLSASSDAMSTAICAAIANSDYVEDPASNSGHIVLRDDAPIGEESAAVNLTNFPQKFNLPVGAVAIEFAEGAFDGNAAHAYGDLAPAQLDRYVYPSSLWYYANTRIKTSTTSKESNYTGAQSWRAILETYEKDNGSVNTATRSIALKDTIQYAVARLDVKIKTGASTLEDNNPVTSLNQITPDAAGFPLTAVLVGGQKNVGFDFAPLSGDVYTIYDNVMTSSINAVMADYSNANSTLVLETAADESVFIAIELVNNTGVDFYGFDGLVPAGAKFYLVGELKAANRSGAEKTDGKVFKKDFTTEARLSIANLKKAYCTIPDLKAPQLEIGLSVDLTWQEGNVYEVSL